MSKVIFACSFACLILIVLLGQRDLVLSRNIQNQLLVRLVFVLQHALFDFHAVLVGQEGFLGSVAIGW